MTTAIAVPAIQRSEIEQLHEILQRRRTLERAAQVAREDHEHQQQTIIVLAARLVDASDESVEHELSAARQRLRELAEARSRAADALHEHVTQNPTPEEILQREAVLAHQAQLAAQRTVYVAFKENVKARIESLENHKALEAAAWELWRNAEQRWPNAIHGPAGEPVLLAKAGIHPTLLDFVDKTYWSWNGKPGAAGGRFGEVRQVIQKWDPCLITDRPSTT